MSPIIEPGIFDLPEVAYHDDPTPTPSLSSSIARILLAQSPRHAWFAHPKLNPAYRREEDEKFDLGTAAHAYILQGERNFSVIDAKDFRTKAAQEARDIAYENGFTPILAHKLEDVRRMAEAVTIQAAQLEDKPIPFQNGRAEETLCWKEGDVWLRARLDYLHMDGGTIDDLKTTGATANPEVWSRTLFNAGLDIQAAFYLRGLKAVLRTEGRFRFVPVENYAPFALSILSLGPEALVLAEKKVRAAIEIWGDCIKRNRWPGYPTRVCYAELPAWEEARWLERELAEEGITDDGRPIGDLLAEGNSRP